MGRLLSIGRGIEPVMSLAGVWLALGGGVSSVDCGLVRFRVGVVAILPANGVADGNSIAVPGAATLSDAMLPVLAGASSRALFLAALWADCCLCALLPKSKNFDPICNEPMTIAITLAATNRDFTRFAIFEPSEGPCSCPSPIASACNGCSSAAAFAARRAAKMKLERSPV